MKKTTQFRKLLFSGKTEFICEAHNGLSAKIVEEAGFPCIWGSGLSISSQFGVRDNNEASWTQVLEVLEFMSDVTAVPILLDGDTGYGNFNNMRRLVSKLEQRNIAAVCIEDKLFPKTNSFVKGTAQPLADMEEFCGKIKAGKDAQTDDDFSIVARVEAFIAGWGLQEALRRAEAYHKAGADAILIHSALGVPDEVLAFKKAWADRSPVLIVPTKYYSTPTEVFRDYGFSIVIWANQILRSAITAMQKTAKLLKTGETLTIVEDRIAPVKEVFRLQGMDELDAAERLYLPRQGQNTAVIVLAAARGKDLGVLTESRPKAMVEIAGQPLLAHITGAYNAAGLKDIIVVRGYKKEVVNLPNLSFADNDEYADSGELYSLKKALDTIAEPRDIIIAYGDVLIRTYIIQILFESTAPFTIIADTNWEEGVNRNRFADYVECSEPLSRRTFNSVVTLKAMSTPADMLERGRIHGEWVGTMRVTADKFSALKSVLDGILRDPKNRNAEIGHLMNALVRSGETVRVLYTTGGWLDIDSVEDIVLAGSFA
ncbi:MAG: phosphoenolpyruvate mutase [Spirochaetales bacterium]|jgi:phosphoenolpyruvate phosphomutase|nr:phosphoenolpyruvate mutase [Spirochaetales bacterium]